MFNLEIFGIILSLMTVCSTFTLSNGLEGENTHALSNVNPSSGPIGPNPSVLSIPNDSKKKYENWAFGGGNFVNEKQYLQQNAQTKDIAQLNVNHYTNNHEVQSQVVSDNRFINVQNHNIPNYETFNFNKNPSLQSSQLPRVDNRAETYINNNHYINENVYRPETQELKQYNQQLKPILLTKDETPVESRKPILREPFQKEFPVRNPEVIYTQAGLQEPQRVLETFNNNYEAKNIEETVLNKDGIVHSKQNINNPIAQKTAPMQFGPNYERHNMLNHPVVKHILKNVKPEKDYLVIYLNGTVEHRNNIQDLKKNYPNHVLFNYPKITDILNSNAHNVNKDSNIDTTVQNKKEDIEPIVKTLPNIVAQTEQINTEKNQESSSHIKTTDFSKSSTQDDAQNYNRQGTASANEMDLKNIIDKQNTAVLTNNEQINNTNAETEPNLVDKEQITSSILVEAEQLNKSTEKSVFTFTSLEEVTKNDNVQSRGSLSDIKNNQDLKLNVFNITKLDKSESNLNDDSKDGTKQFNNNTVETVTTELNNTSYNTISEKTLEVDSENSSESNESDEHDFSTECSSTAQLNTESLNLNEDDKYEDSKENTETTKISNRWNHLKLNGQDLDVLYVLNAPVEQVKITDGEGTSHDCLRIGETASLLSYIICSVLT